MQRFLTFIAVAFLAFLVADSQAGDKKKKEEGPPKVERGPEHKVLETLVGAFDTKVKMFAPDPTKPIESTGVMTRKMILDGNYMQETFKGEFFGKPFNGMAIVGFDPNLKKFTNVWVDNMSTNMMTMHGTYDPTKKTLTMLGEDLEPNTKKKMKARDVLTITSADTQSFEMFRMMEGESKEFKIMEIAFTRKKVEKKVEKQ